MSNFNIKISIECPQCFSLLQFEQSKKKETQWACENCGTMFPGTERYIDMFVSADKNTADHYTLQWGEKFGFLQSYLNKPGIKKSMPAGQLGWDKLFSEIRTRAGRDVISVYDAACGFGGIAYELMKDRGSKNLVYVGADIHNALTEIHKTLSFSRYHIFLMRWDICNRLPLREKFDYVICRASLHHTPDPEQAFAAICSSLKPQGTVAISVYNKKSVCREALDDSLRSVIGRMPREDAFEVCREFTKFGKALQRIKEKFHLDEDLSLLGIAKGEIPVHELIYYHFLKCFYNEEFGDELSTLVNYDWYHPAYAFRYEIDDVKKWFSANGIKITETNSIPAQHYLRGIKEVR